MKKFIITIAPFCIVLFILMWFSWGMEGVLAFFGAVLFIVFLMVLFIKWAKFVDKHFGD